MSDRSYQRWQKMPRIIGGLLERFALCLAQTSEDAARLARLGAPARHRHRQHQVRCGASAGRSARRGPALRPDRRPAGLARGEARIPARKARSSRVHRALAKRHPNLLTIIAPRHPHRGPEVAAIAGQAGLRRAGVRRVSTPTGATDVYVVDTVGEMGLFYRLSPIVLMGGTLVPIGGHNPIEPAKLGAAILHGPHVHTATEIYEALDRARGAAMVKDSASARAGRQRIAEQHGAHPRHGARPARRCRPSAARWTAPCNPSTRSSFKPSWGRGADARAALLVAILSLAAGPSAAPGRHPLHLHRRTTDAAARREGGPSRHLHRQLHRGRRRQDADRACRRQDAAIAAGESPAFLSRGYGGRLRGPVQGRLKHTASDVGDEPIFSRRLPGPSSPATGRPEPGSPTRWARPSSSWMTVSRTLR